MEVSDHSMMLSSLEVWQPWIMLRFDARNRSVLYLLGGWNNIRMSMETVLAMAVATGRVLVLPPSQAMYLLGKKTFSFADFFPLPEIAKEHAGLEIISMKQFLEENKGKLRHRTTNEIVSPPGGRIDWDGDTTAVKAQLNPWFQSIAPNPDWDPDSCFAAFPKSTDPEDAAELQRVFDEIQKNPPKVEDFINNPTPVNATLEQRMREFLATREELCLYTPELQNAQLVHFNGKRDQAGRLLVHFYAFLFFQDYKTDLWMKRFVRDHVRYIDDVQCAAGRFQLLCHPLVSGCRTYARILSRSSCHRSRSAAFKRKKFRRSIFCVSHSSGKSSLCTRLSTNPIPY